MKTIDSSVIMKMVCDKTGVTASEMSINTREVRISHPRLMAMYFMKTFSPLTEEQIIGKLGSRTRSLVSHSRERVFDLRIKESFRKPFDELEKEFKSLAQ